MRAKLAIFLITLFASVIQAYSQDMEQSVYVEESRSKEYAVKAEGAENRNDWKEAISIYMKMIDKFPTEVMKVGNKWQGVQEFILDRLSNMPNEALKEYRFDYDAKAAHEFELAKESRNYAALENLLYKYFYSSQGDYFVDWLANSYFESGEVGEATYWWQRLLRYYPDIKMPRANIISKLAVSLKLLGDEMAIEKLKADFPSEVAEIDKIGNLKTAVVAAQENNGPTLRNDIRRWYKPICLNKINGDTPEIAIPRRLMRGAFPQQEIIPISANAHIASYAKIDNSEYVFYQNGVEASAVEPISGKIYWTTTPDKTANAPQSSFILNSTVDMETKTVFFNMFTSPPEKDEIQRHRFNVPFYSLNIPNSICAIKATTGELLWTIDYDGISDNLKNKDFGFCSAPVVIGNKLYVGLISSPASEPESYVVCVEKSTGKILWLTFICSLVGQQYYYPNISGFYNSTLIGENAGILYALSNLGAIAAVNKNTGNIIWLTKYKRKPRQDYYRPQDITRPPDCPIIYKDNIYCLPQDSDNLFLFDKYSGEIKNYYNCKETKHLLAIESDYVILSGDRVKIFNIKSGKWTESLPLSATIMPRGFVYDNIVYIPTESGIWKYNLETQKAVDEPQRWRDDSDCGNIIVAGDNIISASNSRISSYTNLETIEGEYKRRLEQNPNPLTLAELGDILFENRAFEKANTYYLKYLEQVGDIPKYEKTTLEVDSKLYKLNIALGNKYKNDYDTALEYFAKAKSYAYDEGDLANALAKLAEVYEAKGVWGVAIDQYQEILLKCRSAIYKPEEDKTKEDTDLTYKFSTYAYNNISRIKGERGDKIYARYDILADSELRKATDNIDAIRDVIAKYPNSEGAKEAIKMLIKIYGKKGNNSLSLYYKLLLQNRYKLGGDMELALSVIDDLEALGDLETLSAELENLRNSKNFADMKMPYGNQTVSNFAAEKLQEIKQKQKTANRQIHLPLAKVADLDTDSYFIKPDAELFSPDTKKEIFSDGTAIRCVNIESGDALWRYEPLRRIVPDYIGIEYTPIKNPKNPWDDAIKITGFKENSPALQFPAHLMIDDIIIAIDGYGFKIPGFINLTSNFRQGDKVEFTVIRKGKTLIRTMLISAPDNIISLKYTPDGATILAYQNYLAKISMTTGKEIWSHNFVADGDKITQSEITYDKAFILRKSQFAYTLTCFDNLTGEIEWERTLSTDAYSRSNLQMHIDIANNLIVIGNFYPASPYIEGNQVMTYGSGQNIKFLLLNTANGEDLGDDREFSNVLQSNYDSKNNRLILIGFEQNQASCFLRAINLTLDKTGDIWQKQKIENRLQNPAIVYYPILSSKNYVCLITIPNHQSPNINIYDVKDGKKAGNIYLPKDRVLAANYYPEVTLDDNDIMYIFSAGIGDGKNNVYLTAYSLSENFKVLWDTKVANNLKSVMIDNSNPSFFVLLSGKNVATAIDKKTGATQNFYNLQIIRHSLPIIEFAEYKGMVFKNAKAGTVEIYKQK